MLTPSDLYILTKTRGNSYRPTKVHVIQALFKFRLPVVKLLTAHRSLYSNVHVAIQISTAPGGIIITPKGIRMRTVTRLMPVTMLALLMTLAFALVPTSSTLAHHGGTHKVRLKSITCNDANDSSGTDRTVMKYADQQIWESVISAGETKVLNIEKYVTTQSKIELREKDPWVPDESLGTVYIYASEAGQGEQYRQFTQHGADYTLTYEVLP